MTPLDPILQQLLSQPKRWLVTGAAGFIGSNLLEQLLRLDQRVVGLDEFSTGHRHNLDHVRSAVLAPQWSRFQLFEGDIRDAAICQKACAGVDVVLHHAAVVSVPQSIADPMTTHAVNVQGTLNLLQNARACGVSRFVYASSSAVYGDQPGESMTEERIGRPLSPYAASKRNNEIDAENCARRDGLATVGLRYFNVFGPRQDPNGAYAAVIPKWIRALLRNEPVQIFGDGETTRDFCPIENVAQANLLAATTANPEALNKVYNIACGERTSLNQLFAMLRDLLARDLPAIALRKPEYCDFRPGDVRHSQADITQARQWLGYAPGQTVAGGLESASNWYRQNLV
jgi:UDP-N-acetylglucosamine 4-epimerase